MSEYGNYQNSIPSLSSLDIKNYERIFKVYGAFSGDKEFPYYNILNKVELENIDPQYVDFYDVKTKTPMTTISNNIYGDIISWWIIYLMNKEKFDGPPFWVEGGVKLKFLKPEFRTLLYLDITQNTVFARRHF